MHAVTRTKHLERRAVSDVECVRKKLVTTTFVYDNDGNVIQKTVDGTTTTYQYDYANRFTALGVGGATTTYAYDPFDSLYCPERARLRAIPMSGNDWRIVVVH